MAMMRRLEHPGFRIDIEVGGLRDTPPGRERNECRQHG